MANRGPEGLKQSVQEFLDLVASAMVGHATNVMMKCKLHSIVFLPLISRRHETNSFALLAII